MSRCLPEKIVSIFEEHTDFILRGKEAKPVEYGHKIWLNEVEGGLVSHYRILDGNPSEEKQWKPSLKAHIKTFNHFIPLARQVIQQTTRRILKGEQVPAKEKIVSIFEEHTDIIVRGKEAKPVEYGHKIWLNEVEGGLVSHYRILDGNPSEEKQWKPSLQAHIKTFQHPPVQASADRGLSSDPNEKLAHGLGVRYVVIPKRGYRSKARLKHEHKPWFVKGRHWHAGVEGRISVLKRAHGLGRCLNHGETGFQCWVGWGVIAGNLAVLGRT